MACRHGNRTSIAKNSQTKIKGVGGRNQKKKEATVWEDKIVRRK